ncbi:hypothetical protein JF66_12135 [Cryobacterium sp. MLB-32]|nr:hypothetical protein JF66_12135 [Cryobacterium sp. MLB-32]
MRAVCAAGDATRSGVDHERGGLDGCSAECRSPRADALERDESRPRRHFNGTRRRFGHGELSDELSSQGRPCRVTINMVQFDAHQAGPATGLDQWADPDFRVAEDHRQLRHVSAQPRGVPRRLKNIMADQHRESRLVGRRAILADHGHAEVVQQGSDALSSRARPIDQHGAGGTGAG